MNYERMKEKLEIIADAAKYDVSCSSSGSKKTKITVWKTETGLAFVTAILRKVAVYHC